MSTRRRFLASAAALPLVAAAHSATAQEATPTATPDRGKTTRNVTYAEAGGLPLQLDIYEPPRRDTPRPAVISIHGGAWYQHNAGRSDQSFQAQSISRAGYVVFNISYRLLDSFYDPHVWPAQLEDVQAAVRWVRENAAEYNVDPDRIGAYGLSAGGHLAAHLGVRDDLTQSVSSRVNCVAAHAPYLDLLIPSPEPDMNYVIAWLVGGTPTEVPEAYRDASPIYWVDSESAPFLLLHGTADDNTPHTNSREMAHRLRFHSVEVIHGEFPGLDHWQVIFEWNLHGPWTLEFFARHLQPDR